jgi:hypothetical protein
MSIGTYIEVATYASIVGAGIGAGISGHRIEPTVAFGGLAALLAIGAVALCKRPEPQNKTQARSLVYHRRRKRSLSLG